jgi:hypothetical protein
MLLGMRTEHRKTEHRKTRLGPERRALLAALMARLPEDPAAEVSLFEAFGDELRGTIVVLARRLGMAPLAPDDLDALAFDACAVLATVARWWDPAKGALPWTYGRDRLLAMLRRWEGPRTAPLPSAEVLGAVPAPVTVLDEVPAVAVLDRLVRDGRHPVLMRFHEALGRVVGEADHELVLLYAQQQGGGDPAPSHTVGALVGRSPEAVRQAFSRARRKLRRLALAEPAFRPLLALPLLAETRQGRRAA